MAGGGAERQVAYLATELGKMGWEVHVALLSYGPNLARLRKGGAVTHLLKASKNYDPRIVWQLVQTIRAVQPCLVQVWMIQMEIFGGLAASLMGVPWLLSERSSEMAYPVTFKNRLRVLFANETDAVVSNSVSGDQYWCQRLRKSVPRYVIPNALPLDEIDAARPLEPEESGSRSREKIVLFAGRLSPEKNLDALLLALRTVVSRLETIAVICGEGPLRAGIEGRLEEWGICDRVRVLGYVDNVWSWMKRADAFVSVGFFEGHPNAVLEAMACGCPLVVSDIPSHREFLDEESALLVSPKAPSEIAHAILNVLSAPEAAARRARNARAKAARWSCRSVASQYAKAYQRIIAGAAS